MKPLLALVSLLVLAVVANTAAAATYVYTAGSNYTTVSGAYTTAMTVTGSFTTASPLPANLANVNIGPSGSNLVTAWSFNDGLNTLTNLNSAPFVFTPSNFTVSTNATGQITAFQFVVVGPLPPNTVGQTMNGIAVLNASPYQSIIASGVCNSLTANQCSAIGIGPSTSTAYGSSAAGAFVLAAVPAVPAPMLTPALLALLTGILLAFVFVRTRSLRG